MTGGHDDDTSHCSLEIDSRKPSLRKVKDGRPRLNRIYMYYDEERVYEVKRVSDIRANDYVFAHIGNAPQDHNDTIAVYKDYSRALNDGLFIFEDGDFDCPNRFLEAANLYDSRKPKLEPDRLSPYYFRSNSPIRGQITFNKTYAVQGGQASRRITVVNVDTHGDLSTLIPDRTVIYLGGDHGYNQMDFMMHYLRGSIDRQMVLRSGTAKEKRFARICWREDPDKTQSNRRMQHLQPSSPFPNTWMAWGQRGPNVGLCMSKDGRYVYWPTTLIPEKGRAVSRIPLSEIPLACFDPDAGFDKNYSCNDLRNVVEGAWVMKGDYLATEQLGDELPSGAFCRLRSGFFRCGHEIIRLDGLRLSSRLKKLVQSLGAMSVTGRAALGFRETEESGVYDCKLVDVAKLVDVTVDVIAAYIAETGAAYQIFRGLVGYAGRQFVGPLRVSGPTPIGEWMVGRLYDTGAGLLYNDCSYTYHTVRTVGDVSYLGVCGDAVLERKTLVLGEMLHGEGRIWDFLRPIEYFLYKESESESDEN